MFELVNRLVNREGCGVLARRKLLECLQEIICDGYASIDDAGIGYEPIVVGIGGNIGPFIGIGMQVE
jgi:hypothetical protein